MTDTLPDHSRIVHDVLRAAGVQTEIVQLPESAATAALAAATLGVEIGAIANSLVFWCDDAPLLVMTSGAHRVDTAALADRRSSGRIRRATPEQVRTATGQTIGGVAPVGHPQPVTTIVDASLAEHPQLWAAGGTSHTVFAISFDELVRVTGGTVLRVD